MVWRVVGLVDVCSLRCDLLWQHWTRVLELDGDAWLVLGLAGSLIPALTPAQALDPTRSPRARLAVRESLEADHTSKALAHRTRQTLAQPLEARSVHNQQSGRLDRRALYRPASERHAWKRKVDPRMVRCCMRR
jgi:hypothetical protein